VEELSAPWGERVRAAAVVGSERERVEGGREREIVDGGVVEWGDLERSQAEGRSDS